MRGNRVIVGADTSAYIFEFNGIAWAVKAKLDIVEPVPHGPGDFFVQSVAIKGNFAAFGIPLFDGRQIGDNSGAVYLYEVNESTSTWSFVQTLHADENGTEYDLFGESLAFKDEMLLVGAEIDDDSRGNVIIFEFQENSWIKKTKLTHPDSVISLGFGESIAVDGNTLVVGSAGEGAAFIFVFNENNTSWDFMKKFSTNDAENFGHPVTVSGNTVLVGANDNTYIFKFNGIDWIEMGWINTFGTIYDVNTSHYISLFGQTMLIGVKFDGDRRDRSKWYSIKITETRMWTSIHFGYRKKWRTGKRSITKLRVASV